MAASTYEDGMTGGRPTALTATPPALFFSFVMVRVSRMTTDASQSMELLLPVGYSRETVLHCFLVITAYPNKDMNNILERVFQYGFHCAFLYIRDIYEFI
mmetsp:Transcript_62954/g.73624  ORF Transcript_62954/g.73624 Transcript_62954/m.73624 type:complete len:100 (-) Transcript_62954:856-1155(-)